MSFSHKITVRQGARSASKTIAVLVQLATPTSPVATPAGTDQIDLTWVDANTSPNESGILVERSPDGVTGWTTITTTAADATAYSDTGLDEATTYYYRLTAIASGDDIDSDPTAVFNATTDSGSIPKTFAVHHFTTTSGTQQLRPAAMAGITPKVAILIGSAFPTALNTETAHGSISIGFLASAKRFCASVGGKDAQSPNTFNIRALKDAAVTFCDITSGGPELYAATGSLVSGGVDLTWSAAPPSAIYMTCIMIGGDSVSADVRHIPWLTTGTAITGLGWQPDGIISVGTGAGVDNPEGVGYKSIGDCTLSIGGFDATTKRSITLRRRNNSTTAAPRITINKTRISADLNNAGAVNQGMNIAIDADGYTATQDLDTSAATKSIGMLALDGVSVKVGDFVIPNTTGNVAITGLGWQPSVVLLVTSRNNVLSADSEDSYIATDGPAEAICVSVLSASLARSYQLQGASGATPTTIKSYVSDRAVYLKSYTTAETITATTTPTMDAGGYTVNIDAAPAAGDRQGIYIALG